MLSLTLLNLAINRSRLRLLGNVSAFFHSSRKSSENIIDLVLHKTTSLDVVPYVPEFVGWSFGWYKNRMNALINCIVNLENKESLLLTPTSELGLITEAYRKHLNVVEGLQFASNLLALLSKIGLEYGPLCRSLGISIVSKTGEGERVRIHLEFTHTYSNAFVKFIALYFRLHYHPLLSEMKGFYTIQCKVHRPEDWDTPAVFSLGLSFG